MADERGGSGPPSLLVICFYCDGVYLYTLRLCLWCHVNAHWVDKSLGGRDVLVVWSLLS